MSGNLDPLDAVNPAVIESFRSHHIHSMSVSHQVHPDARALQQYEEADCSSDSHGIEEEGVGVVENGEMEVDGLSGPSHLDDTQPLVTVQPGSSRAIVTGRSSVAFDMCQRGDMPHRIASLMRFREKQKERNFEKKIRYIVRKEVASR
ncbi:hypothetical protein ZIOFF_060738 [Zingiber officinale]|uniref:CCT domain-containing protein n=1 Tax=Zingiber officinale TaxID=94328 RepID=A0A8J5KC91_ZINOF|nr:hypothetical protein ZIOFF_060738 [Zingiber officinale]